MSQHVLFHCVNPHVICYIKSRSLQSTKLRRLRTREGLQGGQTIQQRSEVFASRWSLMLLPVLYIHACALSAHIVCVCQRVYKVVVSLSASATHLWLAATPLSLPEAGNVYSDILGLIVVHVTMPRRRPYRVQGLMRIPSNGTS